MSFKLKKCHSTETVHALHNSVGNTDESVLRYRLHILKYLKKEKCNTLGKCVKYNCKLRACLHEGGGPPGR